jgi:hypothetical protein
MKKIKRGSNIPFFFVKSSNNQNFIKINKKEFFKRYNIHSMIRFHEKEFSKIPEINLTHFNLQHTIHKEGQRYVLVKIQQTGYYTKEEEIPPTIDLTTFYIAECMEVKNNLKYKEITAQDFIDSFSHIKNIEQLKKIIIQRYSKSMPDLSPDEIISLGIATTKLRILEKIKLPYFDDLPKLTTL